MNYPLLPLISIGMKSAQSLPYLPTRWYGRYINIFVNIYHNLDDLEMIILHFCPYYQGLHFTHTKKLPAFANSPNIVVFGLPAARNG